MLENVTSNSIEY